MQTKVMLEGELKNLKDMKVPIEDIKGKRILVTGATGLLGSMICKFLFYLSENGWQNKTVAVVRDIKKIQSVFPDVEEGAYFSFLKQDIAEPIMYEGSVDYIIHAACPTASNTFITRPVETIQAIVTGTMNVLEFAARQKCKSVVYLSSMEAYGQILHEELLKPEAVGYINPLSLRSCYPEGKRMAENVCMGYFSEYQVPVKVIRLAQTFGPGIPSTDGRVFAQFIRSVLNQEDIVMFTEGGSKRMYLDTMDAVSAVWAVLLAGESGQVYNAGNPDNYCSIKEMAQMVIDEFGNGKSQLRIDRSRDVGQYPPDNMLRLDVQPLEKLGWKARYRLKDMYERMLKEV